MLPEVEEYRNELRHLRAEILEVFEGLDAEALNWKPLAQDTNSLYVLATHCIGSEHGWIAETLAQYPKTRNRDAEFVATAADLESLREKFAQTAQNTEKILDELSQENLQAGRPGYGVRHGSRIMTGREIILHVIEHLSEHLGQMRLMRQLWESRD